MSTKEVAVEKLGFVMPYLRDAMAKAKKEGKPQIGILATQPSGAGRIVCQFDAAEFVDDLCIALGLPLENDEETQIDVEAFKIVQAVNDAGATIVSTELPSGEKEPSNG